MKKLVITGIIIAGIAIVAGISYKSDYTNRVLYAY